jgi:hypothetical protein
MERSNPMDEQAVSGGLEKRDVIDEAASRELTLI